MHISITSGQGRWGGEDLRGGEVGAGWKSLKGGPINTFNNKYFLKFQKKYRELDPTNRFLMGI